MMLNYQCKDCCYFNPVDVNKSKFTCALTLDPVDTDTEACYEILPIQEPDDGYDIYEE